MRAALRRAGPDVPVQQLADVVKKTAFKITRMGQLVGAEASEDVYKRQDMESTERGKGERYESDRNCAKN